MGSQAALGGSCSVLRLLIFGETWHIKQGVCVGQHLSLSRRINRGLLKYLLIAHLRGGGRVVSRLELRGGVAKHESASLRWKWRSQGSK
jgi:hypothetical protein